MMLFFLWNGRYIAYLLFLYSLSLLRWMLSRPFRFFLKVQPRNQSHYIECCFDNFHLLTFWHLKSKMKFIWKCIHRYHCWTYSISAIFFFGTFFRQRYSVPNAYVNIQTNRETFVSPLLIFYFVASFSCLNQGSDDVRSGYRQWVLTMGIKRKHHKKVTHISFAILIFDLILRVFVYIFFICIYYIYTL